MQELNAARNYFSRPNEAALICTGCGSSQWLLSEAAQAKEALNGGASAVGLRKLGRRSRTIGD